VPERTLLRWAPVLQREQPRGEFDLSWRWKVTVGRAKDCDVVLKHPSIPLHHGHFVRVKNTWRVAKDGNGSSHNIYLGGKPITFFEEVGGEDVDFAMLVRFRLETIPMGAPERSLREAIAADPTDDGRYLVYADWLLEQGEPLGTQMVSPTPSSAHWLGPLLSDGISVTWRHGFFDTVKVRSATSVFLKAGVFDEVLLHPLAQFLLGLEVDTVLLNAETADFPQARWADWLFEALLANRPAGLRALKVRLPLEHAARFEGPFKALRAKLPHLQTTFDRLFTEGALT
jgi:uncharacterized protein (TIGR02996 family)